MKKHDAVPPAATVRVGRAAFGIWTTVLGVRALSLPDIETLFEGERASPVDVSVNRELRPEETRFVAEAASFIDALFQGINPRVRPSIDLDGIGEFERSVLEAALEVPRGETRSYGWIADRIGKPSATRAVGQALGRNPIPLVVPCHRIIKKDGSLGGYGRGTDWKKCLLSMERKKGNTWT